MLNNLDHIYEFIKKSGHLRDVRMSYVEKCMDSYPEIYIRGEFEKMEMWLESNPSRRPKVNLERFCTHWLNKAKGDYHNQLNKRSKNEKSRDSY